MRGITKHELGNSKLIKFLTIRAASVMTHAGFENLSELVDARELMVGLFFLQGYCPLEATASTSCGLFWFGEPWSCLRCLSVSLNAMTTFAIPKREISSIVFGIVLSSCLSLKECLMIAVSAKDKIPTLVPRKTKKVN